MDTVKAIFLGAIISAAFRVTTFATPIVHDNADGLFRWIPVSTECPFPECTSDEPTRLDITQPADQVGGVGIQLWYSPDSTTPHFRLYWIEEVAADAESAVLADEEGYLHDFHFATAFSGGEAVEPRTSIQVSQSIFAPVELARRGSDSALQGDSLPTHPSSAPGCASIGP